MSNQQMTLQTQGQVSWDAIASQTANFSWGVLNRLSKAGIDALTVVVGRATCSAFAIQAPVQQKIMATLNKLESFSLFGQAMYVGFGLKHVIVDLAETEQGLACVALCACLTNTYDSVTVAQVLRELWKVQSGPRELTPALHQWQNLVEVCAKSLSKSQFPQLVEGMSRLATVPGVPHHLGQIREPAKPTAISKALQYLSQVSQGKLISVTFIGGIDCAWLAACAEWLLSLTVEIKDAGDQPLYRSSGLARHKDAQVIIRFEHSSNEGYTRSRADIILAGKSFVVPPGALLNENPKLSWPSNYISMQSNWSSLLTDAFGPDFVSLREAGEGMALRDLLVAAAQAADDAYFRDSNPTINSGEVTSWDYFDFSHSQSRGAGFLCYVDSRLPELRPVIPPSGSSNPCAPGNGLDCLKAGYGKLRKLCRCSICRAFTDYMVTLTNHTETPPIVAPETERSSTCLAILARTIVQFLFLLSRTVIQEGVLPKSSSLQYLHRENVRATSYPRSFGGYDNGESLLESTFRLFCGVAVTLSWPGRTVTKAAAIAEGGLCVYYSVLEGLVDEPSRLGLINVVLGHLTHDGTRYRGLCDQTEHPRVWESFDAIGYKEGCSAELVADDNTFDMILRGSYQILDQESTLVGHVLLAELVQSLCRMPSYSKCTGGQPDVSCTTNFLSKASNTTIECSLSQLCSQEAIDTFSRSINSIRNKWISFKYKRERFESGYAGVSVEIGQVHILQAYSLVWLSRFQNDSSKYHIAQIHQSCNVCVVKEMAQCAIKLLRPETADLTAPGEIPMRFTIKSAGSTVEASVTIKLLKSTETILHMPVFPYDVPGRIYSAKSHVPMKERSAKNQERRKKPARPTANESTSDDGESSMWESTDGGDSELSEWTDDDGSVNSKSSQPAGPRAGLRLRQRAWRGRVRFDHRRLRK